MSDSRSRRVLVWTRNFPPPNDDGTAVFVWHLCEELSRLGHAVRVLVEKPAPQEGRIESSFTVEFKPSWRRLSSIGRNLYLARAVLQRRPDAVLLGHAGSLGVAGLVWLSRYCRIPYAVLVHGGDLVYSVRHSLDRWCLKRLLSNAAAVFTNSRYTRELLERQGFEVRGIEVLWPGVDCEIFRPLPRQVARSHLGLADERVLLSVSALRPRKGHETVLRALAKLKGETSGTTYLIAGRGPEYERLRALTSTLGLENDVRFLGFVSDDELPLVYNACDVFVLPARTTAADIEGFGIVFSEASACGKAIIAGSGGGVSEAVIHGQTGLLVDPTNADELAAAIKKLFSDPSLIKRLGSQGRQRVTNELSWKNVGRKFEERFLGVSEVG